MKACTVAPGTPETAGVEELPVAAVGTGDLLVDGLLVGVCGTDVEIATKGYGEPPPGHERIVLFHESLGRVVEAPAGGGFSAGDLVVGIVRRPDPLPCECCARGEWDFCRNGGFTERGIKQRDGYGARQWRVEPEFAIAVPATLGDLGVLTEPASVVAKGWEQIERIGARSCFEPRRVLVTGAGPIGLLAALMAVQRGLEVHVVDRVDTGPKPDLVRDLGGSYHTSLADLGCQPDIVVECTGVGQLVFDVLCATAPNAIVCLAGLSQGTRRIATDADAINKELVLENDVVFGTVNASRRHYELAVDALARADAAWLARLVSRRVPFEKWPTALERQPDDVKVVVDLQA
jgi:threonine dehydrogenase-like Zn-dependent dehydrogenase